jgi:hypothetical protein
MGNSATLLSINAALHRMPEYDKPLIGNGFAVAVGLVSEQREAY